MLQWLIAHSSHFVVPLTLLLCSFGIYMGWIGKKRGWDNMSVKFRRVTFLIGTLLVCFSCFLLGIIVSR
jgi:uncharacterized membrane protein